MKHRLRWGSPLVLSVALALLVPPLSSLAAGVGPEGGGGSTYELTGTVESLPVGLLGDWVVAGRTIHVGASTEINQTLGPAKVGATVRVRGTLNADGTVTASDVEVKTGDDGSGGAPTRFTAQIQSLPASGFVGDWNVGGKTVHVGESTRIVQDDGSVAVGATVEVSGTLRADGSVDADEIEVRQGAAGGGPGGGQPGEDRHLFGLVEKLPASGLVGDWTVAGTVVHVTPATVLAPPAGPFALGSYVEVEGKALADGSIDAKQIELRKAAPPADASPESFRGAVLLLPATPGWIGDWSVGGRTVHVSGTTSVDQEHGTLALGSLVEVKGTALVDGSVAADRIEVEWGPATSGASLSNTFILPSSARKAGKDGAFYTTDLTVSNVGPADAQVTLRFLGHERDGRTGPEKSFTLAAGATVTFSDVLSSQFGLSDDYGAILVSSNVATLVVESSTSTPGGGGTFGQGLRATERNELVSGGRTRSLVGVRDDAKARTNLVLANAVEKEIDVDLFLFGADGSALGSLRVHLDPLGMKQVNDVSRALGASGGVAGARLVLGTPTPGGAFAAYASVIDNGTNDPRILSPR